MQLADFKAYYAEDGRIVWENVATLHEEVRIFRSAFVPMMYYIISNDVMILMIAEQYIPIMSCMQVIRLEEFDATTYYDCGTNIITLA